MKKQTGDLIKLAQSGEFDVIIHGCNCFCTMGAGIALQIKKNYPKAYEEDCKTSKGDKGKLGSFTYSEEGVVVVNAYTQYHWRGPQPRVDYEAVRSVFKALKLKFSGKRFGYPLIGAGLAGGDWNIISNIIDEELNLEDHTLVLYG